MTHNSWLMPVDKVLWFSDLLKQNHIQFVIDGGWGVDALLGEQTRPHEDLDIAVNEADVPKIRVLLEERGFREVPRDDSWECNFVMGDELGHLIDLHSCTFDEGGRLLHGVPYPFESLQGTGFIAGQPVRCISPEWMVKFHTGYPLDENDYHDVNALCDRFSLSIPPDYDRFQTKK
jgi:lincosamide nucleotidyltransferase A/C/D/E